MAVLLLAALLSACTYSESLRQDEFWPLRPLPGAARGPALFYVTDRQPDGAGFGLTWGASLSCGRAVLTLGTQHGYDLAPGTEPAQSCDAPAALDDFVRRIADTARAANCDRLLVMVHGYNAVFRNTVLRSGQLAADMHWRCPVLLFSWSSEGRFNRYVADIERSGYAVPQVAALLKTAGRDMKLAVMGHSIGARIVLSALGRTCRDAPLRLADELVLAAPDVNAQPGNDDFGRFLSQVAPCVGRATVYVSDNDTALAGSQRRHGGIPRAGEKPHAALQYASRGPQMRVDVIDASQAPGDRAGHGYFSLAYEMTDDMEGVVTGLTAEQRLRRNGRGTLECEDAQACAAGRYMLYVTPERRPGFSIRLLRSLWRIILPLQ